MLVCYYSLHSSLPPSLSSPNRLIIQSNFFPAPGTYPVIRWVDLFHILLISCPNLHHCKFFFLVHNGRDKLMVINNLWKKCYFCNLVQQCFHELPNRRNTIFWFTCQFQWDIVSYFSLFYSGSCLSYSQSSPYSNV